MDFSGALSLYRTALLTSFAHWLNTAFEHQQRSFFALPIVQASCAPSMSAVSGDPPWVASMKLPKYRLFTRRLTPSIVVTVVSVRSVSWFGNQPLSPIGKI